MGAKMDAEIPAGLAEVQRKLEQWRRGHRRGAPLAEGLWRQAAELAGVYGVNPIARALRLDYYSLKKHAALAARSGKAVPGFVELLPGGITAPPGPGPMCTIALEDGQGVKLRIRLEGGTCPDVAALVRTFRERGEGRG
jgi:hypothetical protein